MNIFKKIYARLFQTVLYVGANFINFRKPILYSGNNSTKHIIDILKKHNKKDLFIVTDNSIFSLGLLDNILSLLNEENIRYSIFKDVYPNPTISQVESGLKMYKDNNHSIILCIGGGSVMDCAKIIGARATNLKRSVEKMKGLFKITHKTPTIIAIPTTAGTGSETTLAAVIVNDQNHAKYSCTSPKLVPTYAILDPSLLTSLPGKITSTTGMDTLTHSIEAFIGRSNVISTKKNALSSIKLVVDNLEKSYNDPTNLIYRENMQIASFQGGLAFTRAYVGYVHAISHAISGKYNIPHGLANAVILPIVLEAFGSSVYSKLAKIYDHLNLPKTTKLNKAKYIIDLIKTMNKNMNIENTFGSLIKDEDIDGLAIHAYKEAYPLYPVPKLFSLEEIKSLIKTIQSNN